MMHKILESVANVAILVTCLAIGATLIRNHSVPQHLPDRSAHGIHVGEQVPLSAVDWKAHRKTLILALSTTCQFCTESAPLYKMIAEATTAKGGIEILAVFPQPVEVSRKYLSDLGVDIRDIRQARLSELKVRATPTIVLADASGIVERVWVGKVSNAEEDELRTLK